MDATATFGWVTAALLAGVLVLLLVMRKKWLCPECPAPTIVPVRRSSLGW